jgi:hypothetical protein
MFYFRRDATTTVRHGESQYAFSIRPPIPYNVELDASLICKLDGIAKKIEKNLLDPAIVTKVIRT